MVVPIQVIRWYRMQCYGGTDSCATVVPIRRYCHDMSVNYPTLRNIRDGKEMKKATERFYLKLFFDLINKEYERRMASGGDGAVSLLVVMKNILEAELK